MIALVFCLGLIVLSAVLAMHRPKSAVLLCIGALPWQGIEADVGLRLTAYQLVTCGFLVGLCLAKRSVSVHPRGRRFCGLDLYLILAVGLTLVGAGFAPPIEVLGGPLRAHGVRPLLQLVSFAITISPLFYVAILNCSPTDLQRCAKAYVLSCVVLSIVGCAQLAVWILSGNDPFPVGYVNSLLGGFGADGMRSGINQFRGTSLYRMSSFGGEPRYLGVSFVVALLILQIFAWTGRGLPRVAIIVSTCLLALSIAATQSTSALAVLVIVSLSLGLLKALGNRSEPFGFRAIGISLALTFAMGLVAAILVTKDRSVSGGIEWVSDFTQTRTVDRLSAAEDMDDAVLSFLSDHPYRFLTGVGMGNIHLYALDYINPEYRYYMANTAFTAKSGALKVLSETGVLSLLALVMPLWLLRRKSLPPIRRGSSNVSLNRVNCGRAVVAIAIVALLRAEAIQALFLAIPLVHRFLEVTDRHRPQFRHQD
jgi:hypothetical protein